MGRKICGTFLPARSRWSSRALGKIQGFRAQRSCDTPVHLGQVPVWPRRPLLPMADVAAAPLLPKVERSCSFRLLFHWLPIFPLSGVSAFEAVTVADEARFVFHFLFAAFFPAALVRLRVLVGEGRARAVFRRGGVVDDLLQRVLDFLERLRFVEGRGVGGQHLLFFVG